MPSRTQILSPSGFCEPVHVYAYPVRTHMVSEDGTDVCSHHFFTVGFDPESLTEHRFLPLQLECPIHKLPWSTYLCSQHCFNECLWL